MIILAAAAVMLITFGTMMGTTALAEMWAEGLSITRAGMLTISMVMILAGILCFDVSRP